MASTRRPVALAAFTEISGPPAWKTIPSRATVATEDNEIGTTNERFMATRAANTQVVEVSGASHAMLVSHPDAVVDLILRAAHAIP